MTETDNQNTTRSTLTLKLKPAADSSTLTLKNVENKKISSSAVQVTIKGRKREVKNDSSELNKRELEARFKAVSATKKLNLEDDVNSHDILSKLAKSKKQEQQKKF